MTGAAHARSNTIPHSPAPLLVRIRQGIAENEALAHWVLVIPALLFYIPLQIVPVVGGFALSLTDWSGMGLRNMKWIGMGNYAELLRDDLFWRSCRITAIYVFTVAPMLLILSVVAAVALNSKSRLTPLSRTAILVPIAMSPVTIGTLFNFLASPTLGFPALFKAITDINLLNDPLGALGVVIVAQIWAGLGVSTFVFLAGLQAIPEEIYEAAKIDGAGAVARFLQVTLPLLRETMIMNTIVTLINAFKTFGMILVMTQGGPYHATEVLALFMYRKAFFAFRLGYGSAVAVVMFVIIAIVTFVQMRVTRAGTTEYY
jgi:ABC-type sugar transport system permease subunit